MILNSDNFSSPLPEMNVSPPDKLFEQTEESGLNEKKVERKPFVLVFGSDEDSRFLFKTILEIWDYDTAEAVTVEQAIRVAEFNRPDIVLMDTEFLFPESFAEMRKMRKCELFKNVPFILISGHAQEDVRLMALAVGAADFFVKPVNLDHLEIILKTSLSDLGQ